MPFLLLHKQSPSETVNLVQLFPDQNFVQNSIILKIAQEWLSTLAHRYLLI